jgi:hypothetical protein
MKKRPHAITVICWIFIVFGSIALLAGVLPNVNITPAQRVAELKGHWFVHLARMVMILSGVFMLYGFNWARWLLVAWLTFHVIIGALHSPLRFGVHVLLLVIVVYFLFSPAATGYFRGPEDGDINAVRETDG